MFYDYLRPDSSIKITDSIQIEYRKKYGLLKFFIFLWHFRFCGFKAFGLFRYPILFEKELNISPLRGFYGKEWLCSINMSPRTRGS